MIHKYERISQTATSILVEINYMNIKSCSCIDDMLTSAQLFPVCKNTDGSIEIRENPG